MSMKFSKLIDRSEIKEEIRQIEDAPEYYIDNKGNVYHRFNDTDLYYPMKNNINNHNGYVYNTLTINGISKKFRNHILVAKAFIDNPNNLPIVGHLDNDKTNNSIDNLVWCTYSENSQKAVDDGLLVNAKGFEDSQSTPTLCYDIEQDKFIIYGSMSEASRGAGVSKSTVRRQMDLSVGSNRCGYYFFDYYDFINRLNSKFSNDYQNHL